MNEAHHRTKRECQHNGSRQLFCPLEKHKTLNIPILKYPNLRYMNSYKFASTHFGQLILGLGCVIANM